MGPTFLRGSPLYKWYHEFHHTVSPQEAGSTWMVYKKADLADEYYDEMGEPHPWPDEINRTWGIMVNPNNVKETCTLSGGTDGYVLLDGLRFELDTYIWAVADLCMEGE